MFANDKSFDKEEIKQERLSIITKSFMDTGEKDALNRLLDRYLPVDELVLVWKRASTNEQIAKLFKVPEEMVALQGARLFNQMII